MHKQKIYFMDLMEWLYSIKAYATINLFFFKVPWDPFLFWSAWVTSVPGLLEGLEHYGNMPDTGSPACMAITIMCEYNKHMYHTGALFGLLLPAERTWWQVLVMRPTGSWTAIWHNGSTIDQVCRQELSVHRSEGAFVNHLEGIFHTRKAASE